jgi:hypothetical protein
MALGEALTAEHPPAYFELAARILSRSQRLDVVGGQRRRGCRRGCGSGGRRRRCGTLDRCGRGASALASRGASEDDEGHRSTLQGPAPAALHRPNLTQAPHLQVPTGSTTLGPNGLSRQG